MTLRFLLFIIRRHSPAMQRRLITSLLHELGLSRSKARAAAALISTEENNEPHIN